VDSPFRRPASCRGLFAAYGTQPVAQAGRRSSHCCRSARRCRSPDPTSGINRPRHPVRHRPASWHTPSRNPRAPPEHADLQTGRSLFIAYPPEKERCQPGASRRIRRPGYSTGTGEFTTSYIQVNTPMPRTPQRDRTFAANERLDAEDVQIRKWLASCRVPGPIPDAWAARRPRECAHPSRTRTASSLMSDCGIGDGRPL